MPKRTNEFQRLVTILQLSLMPKGATIVPSALIHEPNFGPLREIDVLVTVESETCITKIAVEAKDQKRKLDTTQVEAVIGKYRSKGSVEIDKVILICRNGSSRNARRKAEQNGIVMMSLREANLVDWSQYLPTTLPTDPRKFKFCITPHVTAVTLFDKNLQPLNPQTVRDSRLLCRCHNSDFGNPSSFAKTLWQTNYLSNDEFEKEFKTKLTEFQNLKVIVRRSLHMFVLSMGEIRIELSHIEFSVLATEAMGAIKFNDYALDQPGLDAQHFQHASLVIAGRRIEFLNSPRQQKITMKFGKLTD